MGGPEMKHLVVFSILVASSLGKVEINGIFQENQHIPALLRQHGSDRAGIDCSPPTVEDCKGNANYHPYPCDCHKYFQCVNGALEVHECIPIALIFNPLTENCEYENTAPPGLCVDTPDPASSTTSGPTTATPTPTPTTTMESTTPRNCWICDGCTCDASVDVDGFFKPHPENCHWYYECVYDATDKECPWSSKGPFDCGDWAFNPEQASCTWPEFVPDCN